MSLDLFSQNKKEVGKKQLAGAWLDSPLGPILAISDDKELYLLEFAERKGLKREIQRLLAHTSSVLFEQRSEPIDSLERELKQYFAGNLTTFKTPIHLLGTPFQKEVWAELLKISPGQTCSYSTIATAVNRPSSQRAVANAIGANQLAIVIPCHRVIQANGSLGGYAGGTFRKRQLIELENLFNPTIAERNLR